MKIKRRDLVHLIREMAMDEMAYMGVRKPVKGKHDYFKGDPSFDPDRIERFFKTKRFQKQAKLFFGETKAFPGSNVIIVPRLGQFEWGATGEESQEKKRFRDVEPFLIDLDASRARFYDLNDETMKILLEFDQEEIDKVDQSKDVVLYVTQGQISYRFNTTVHQIFHSFFEGIVESYENEDLNLARFLPNTLQALKYLYEITRPTGTTMLSTDSEINTVGSIRTNATKYLRGKAHFTKGFLGGINTGDFFSEMLTASFLRYSNVKNEVLYDDKDSDMYGEVDEEKTQTLNKLLANSSNELTNFSRGKILEISVYESD
jgi:hypothetical protein